MNEIPRASEVVAPQPLESNRVETEERVGGCSPTPCSLLDSRASWITSTEDGKSTVLKSHKAQWSQHRVSPDPASELEFLHLLESDESLRDLWVGNRIPRRNLDWMLDQWIQSGRPHPVKWRHGLLQGEYVGLEQAMSYLLGAWEWFLSERQKCDHAREGEVIESKEKSDGGVGSPRLVRCSSFFCAAVIGDLTLMVPGIGFNYDEDYLPLPWVYWDQEKSSVYRAMTQAGMISRALEEHGQMLCSHWTADSKSPPEMPPSTHRDLPDGWPDEFRNGSPIRSLAVSIFLGATQTPTQLHLVATP